MPAIHLVSFTVLGQVKPAGTLCRAAKNVCDLEDYCDGRQPACPEDAFQENGTPCLGGYCYNGACPTLAQRCQDLWGPGKVGMSLAGDPQSCRVVSGPKPDD